MSSNKLVPVVGTCTECERTKLIAFNYGYSARQSYCKRCMKGTTFVQGGFKKKEAVK